MGTQESCEKALDEHEEKLSGFPNVVGLGIVDDPDGDGAAVAVYVSEKVPLEDLVKEDRIPKRLTTKIDEEEQWVPVSVIEQGIVTLE